MLRFEPVSALWKYNPKPENPILTEGTSVGHWTKSVSLMTRAFEALYEVFKNVSSQ